MNGNKVSLSSGTSAEASDKFIRKKNIGRTTSTQSSRLTRWVDTRS